MSRRSRRALSSINRSLDRRQNDWGEGVLWYEQRAEDWDPEENTYLTGGRSYTNPIAIKCFWVTKYEADERAEAEGRRSVATLRLSTSMRFVKLAGLSDPTHYERHLNDLILYDRTLYNIGSYQLKGRMDGEDVLLAVSATKIFPDEDMSFDELPPGIEVNQTRRTSDVVDTYDPIFPDYDLPARQS